jgi:hypothetical protein
MSENREAEHRTARHSSFFRHIGAFLKRTADRAIARFKRRRQDAFSNEDGEAEASEQTRRFGSAESAAIRRTQAPARQAPRELPHISREHLSGEGKEHMSMFTPRHRQPSFSISVILTSFRLVLVLIFMIAPRVSGALVGIAKALWKRRPRSIRRD